MLNFNFKIQDVEFTDFCQMWKEGSNETLSTRLAIVYVYSSKQIPLTVLYTVNLDKCTIAINEIRCYDFNTDTLVDFSKILDKNSITIVKGLIAEFIANRIMATVNLK